MRRALVVRALAVVWLTVVWCALLDSASLGTVVAGVVVGLVLTLVFPSVGGSLAGTRVRLLPLVAMNASFFVALVRANLEVAWAVIAPSRAGLRRAIVAVPLVPSSELALGLLLNVVSLTPGTLILEVRRTPPVLYIHVLQLRSEAALHLQIYKMHRSVVAALGPSEALPAIEARIAVLADATRAEGPVPPLEVP